MTSPLPPRHRDSRNLADLTRQNKTNLGQAVVGLVGGRFSPARPLRPVYDGDEVDDGDDGDEMGFWNTDRVTVTTAGIVSLPLTYAPIDGSLHIRWDGLDQPPAEWTLAGQTVIFTNPHLHVGDVLTAAYAYYLGDIPGSPLAATAVARTGTFAWGTNSGTSGGGPPMPLPGGTQIGDLIVLSVFSTGAITITDPRLTHVGNNMWIGWATDLSSVAITFVDPWFAVACDTFATNATGWTAAQVASNTSIASGGTIPTPVVADVSVAICAASAEVFAFGVCSIGTPTGYTTSVAVNNALSASVHLWTNSEIATSSAGTLSYAAGGGTGSLYATVVGLIGPVD